MHRRSLLALGLAALATPAFAQGPWRTIFDGRSLAGWTPIGDANWTSKDGAMEADKGAISFLVSAEDYGDFEMRAEVYVSPEANSGIFIRCSNPAQITAANAYEVNIYDTRPDPTYGTGAIVNVAKVDPMPKAGGRWNVLEVIAKGDSFTVKLNGATTVNGAKDAKWAKGRLALQYGSGVVKFRKVEVRTL